MSGLAEEILIDDDDAGWGNRSIAPPGKKVGLIAAKRAGNPVIFDERVEK